MDIEKLKLEAQSKALHIADVSGSAWFNADCMDILPLIPDGIDNFIHSLVKCDMAHVACSMMFMLELQEEK